MKEVIFKNKFIKVNHVWFKTDDDICQKKADILMLHGINEPKNKGSECRLQNTLITDLSVSEESLFNNIGKTAKYDIRKSMKENIGVAVFTSEDLIKDFKLLKDFFECYKKMYFTKGITSNLSTKAVLPYIEEKVFLLSVALLNNEIIVYHSYIFEANRTRLLHSCSDFRNAKANRNLIGRANKLLHFKDMLYFKERGLKFYDWGGISSFEKPNGIDNFKIELAGEAKKHKYYNQSIPTSFKGKIYTFLRSFLRK